MVNQVRPEDNRDEPVRVKRAGSRLAGNKVR
jgi:hypothetical protein